MLVARLRSWSMTWLVFLWVAGIALAVALVGGVGGCASRHKDPPQLSANAPFSDPARVVRVLEREACALEPRLPA